MKKYRFLFTGGGTGGHVYPNIAIYEALKEKYPEAEFLYVGTRRGSEAAIVPSLPQPMDFISVPARGLPQRVKSPKTILAAAAILAGALKSWFILRRFKPDVIIGSGGYVSAPVLLAAALLKKSVFIHEQNAVPGRLNLFVARFAAKIGVAFPSTASFFPRAKVVETGYPLRQSIRGAGNGGALGQGPKGREKFGIPPDSRVLFICSGSMGARTINRAAADVIPRLLSLPNLFVIMSTGKAYGKGYRAYDDTVKRLEQQGYPAQIEGRLLVREYFDQIAEIYDLSTLAVSRAGAGAIQEITAKGLPAILVPKIDLPGDHQILNAREVEKIGGARVLYEEAGGRSGAEIILAADALASAAEELLADPGRLAAMRRSLQAVDKPDSAAIIVEVVEGLIGKKKPVRAGEIQVFYLQALEQEKNLELPFPTTVVGSSFLADVPLEGLSGSVRFTIRLPGDEAGPARIRLQRGSVLLNDREPSGWTPLRPDDRLAIDGQTYIFKSYREKIEENGMALAGGRGPRDGRFVSLLTDFGRAIAAAALFGAGRAVDVFAAALAAAGFLRRLVGVNALSRSFQPVFARLFQRGPRRKAWEAASSFTAGTLLLSLLLAAAALLLAPLLMRLLLPGFAAAGLLPAAVKTSRILFASVFLGTLSALAAVLLRAFRRDTVPDLSLLLFAAGAIGGIFLFLPAGGMQALAWGVLLGVVLQLLLLLPFLARTLSRPALEFAFRPSFRAASQATRKFAAELAPAGLGAALTQAPLLVERFVASLLGMGAISYLYFAMELLRLPFTLTARLVHKATRRGLDELHAPADREDGRTLLVAGFRNTLFLLAPLSLLLAVLAEPIVVLLLQRAHFGPQETAHTALALQLYAAGLMGWGILALTGRIFALRLEGRLGLLFDLLLLAVQAPLAVLLARTRLGFAGIALATSIAVTVLAAARVAVLLLRLRGEGAAPAAGELLAAAGKTLGASALMAIAVIETRFVFDRIQFGSRVVDAIAFCVSLSFMGMAVYFLSSLLLKNTGILMFRKRRASGGGQPISLLSPSRFLEAVSPNPDFYKAEYRYKSGIYLASPSWEVRNIGIKLAGLFKDKAKVPYLVDLLREGRGNGFMRRNALQALKAIHPWSPEIKDLLLRLLSDGYFEVRAAALEYLGQGIGDGEYPELRDTVRRRLARGSSEERVACLRLMARKGDAGDLPYLRRLYLDSSSLVREEVLELLYSYYRRGLLAGDEIKQQVQQVLVTSNHLTPEFRIKSIIQRIVREVDRP